MTAVLVLAVLFAVGWVAHNAYPPIPPFDNEWAEAMKEMRRGV